MKASGWILLVIGVVGLITIYSYRPPSGVGQTVRMYAQGQTFFFKEPVYEILLAGFGIISVFGIVKIVKGKTSQ